MKRVPAVSVSGHVGHQRKRLGQTMTMSKTGLGSPGGTVSSTSFFANSSTAEA